MALVFRSITRASMLHATGEVKLAIGWKWSLTLYRLLKICYKKSHTDFRWHWIRRHWTVRYGLNAQCSQGLFFQFLFSLQSHRVILLSSVLQTTEHSRHTVSGTWASNASTARCLCSRQTAGDVSRTITASILSIFSNSAFWRNHDDTVPEKLTTDDRSLKALGDELQINHEVVSILVILHRTGYDDCINFWRVYLVYRKQQQTQHATLLDAGRQLTHHFYCP